MRRYVEVESGLFCEGLWESMRVAWLPGLWSVMHRADHKIKQLQLASALGLTVPPTLITNDANELFRFHQEHGGELISKLPGPAAYWLDEKVVVRHTLSMTRSDRAYAMSSLRYSPMIFQPRVAKALDVRITVVGGSVFAAEIHSQRNGRAAIDCRLDSDHTPHHPHELPNEVAAACVALTRQLDLLYSTIDLIVTPNGEYLFLELNPNGQYLWIEKITGLPISEAIVDQLLSYEGTHDDAVRPAL
jgi:glutathione synthase/RimK-type ligase-like ATP-grasp enzyme